MPGHKVTRSTVKDLSLFDKYQCPHCHLLLKDAVQSVCGHWLCDSCAAQLQDQRCPQPDCREDFKSEKFFPDRFVRREIKQMLIFCPHQCKGCNWEDSLGKLEAHLKTCDFTSEECPQCGTVLTPEQVEPHKLTCPKAMIRCPLAEFGYSTSLTMTREELEQHMHEFDHLQLIFKMLHRDKAKASAMTNNGGGASAGEVECLSIACCADFVDTNGPKGLPSLIKHPQQDTTPHCPFTSASTVSDSKMLQSLALLEGLKKLEQMYKMGCMELVEQKKSLQSVERWLEKVQSSLKNTELEDRDFRLSLIENSNYDGTVIWKIPQFNQRMCDAEIGKCTSIFSLPFYTGQYGYKMCLRLYILGDGIGKNSHISLFFVVMKGEFDNILQWPFTHKVTFKLINQTEGRDIIDTFQPDPMSSSFRKPMSDMNIASGFPRFFVLSELLDGGFVKDDSGLVIEFSVGVDK